MLWPTLNRSIQWVEVRETIPPYVSKWSIAKRYIRWVVGRYTIEDYLFDRLADEIRQEVDKEIISAVRQTREVKKVYY